MTDRLIAGDGSSNNRRKLAVAYRWSDRFQWLTSLFRSGSEVGFATASAGLVATVAGMTVLGAVETRRNSREPGVIAETKRQTKNSTVFQIIGFDKAGRRGVFDVVVLNKEFKWVLGSADALEHEGQVVTASDIATEVLDEDVRGGLAEAREIVAVGTASQEGEAANEIERAGKRALRTAEFAKTAAMDQAPLWTLNLGQYRDPCTSCETTGTSWQRPFIVIAVKELEDGTVLGEALNDAMTGKGEVPSPASYSAFDMKKVR